MHRQVRFAFWSLAVCLLTIACAAAQDKASLAHPLDPLSKEEITSAVEVLKSGGKVNDASRFVMIALNEPPKEEVINFKPGAAMRREASVVVYEREANKTFEGVVDLKKKTVLAWREVPGVQPSALIEEFFFVPGLVRSNPGWQEAMKKRGITDFENVQLDAWSAGNFGFPDEEGVRVVRAVAYYRGKSTNPYARPIEGVVAYVNMNTKKVFKVVDTGVVPVSKANGDFDEVTVGKLREAPRDLQIVQPQGASFEVRGNEVRWQKWRFRYTLHPREGLVLYTVGYEDEGKVRSVLYRASLSEMVVPYGDPGTGWFFRNAFDEGEFGVGRGALTLEPGTDYLSNATLFDAVFAGDTGSAYSVPRAVALYERDGGILWKHVDYISRRNESRRARELVLSYVANVGNYEYGFDWVFHQDGTLEMEVLLTGIMAAKGVMSDSGSPEDHESAHGHLVADNVMAVHHQHFFNFRLDMDVEGQSNSIVEMNTQALPAGRDNPYNNAFTMKETPLAKEKDAQRVLSLEASRKWKIINPSIRNSLGQPVGYMLVPGENSIPFAAASAQVSKRAGFMKSHLWVTPYNATEMHAAGEYVNQSKGGDGLPRWTSANRSIENRDIVVWYTMGITHIPRPEEWPVMPVHKAGFKLMPNGFFARNPALDVPKPK